MSSPKLCVFAQEILRLNSGIRLAKGSGTGPFLLEVGRTDYGGQHILFRGKVLRGRP